MKIAFTLCSNNYLAQAKTLGNSLLLHNPNYQFIIGLVDKLSVDIDYTAFDKFEIIEVEKINIPNFGEFWKKYNIIELNTSVKPFYIEYIFKNKQLNSLIYFDPDIIIFRPLKKIENYLTTHDVILTPHFCSPPKDDLNPSDYDMLRTGVYNLGFIALNNNTETNKFNDWWKEKMINQGYANLSVGLFYDQIWMLFAPAFIDNVMIMRDLGHNVASWNLHERYVSEKNHYYYVNDTFELVFYHFSNYKIDLPDIFASYTNRFTLSERSDVEKIFGLYRNSLLENNHLFLQKIEPYYTTVRNEYLSQEKETKAKELKLLKEIEAKELKLFPTIKRVLKKIIRRVKKLF